MRKTIIALLGVVCLLGIVLSYEEETSSEVIPMPEGGLDFGE